MGKVEFYIDDTLLSMIPIKPYKWTWNTLAFSKLTVKVIAYDILGRNLLQTFTIWKFF